ncbi:MAG: hypothetical protein R2857_07900 [Vampirovibrionales bacterium]
MTGGVYVGFGSGAGVGEGLLGKGSGGTGGVLPVPSGRMAILSGGARQAESVPEQVLGG